MASKSGETLTDCTAWAGRQNDIKAAMRTTTPMTPRQPPEARFGDRFAYAAPRERLLRFFKTGSVKIGPRQSWTRVAFDQAE